MVAHAFEKFNDHELKLRHLASDVEWRHKKRAASPGGECAPGYRGSGCILYSAAVNSAQEVIFLLDVRAVNITLRLPAAADLAFAGATLQAPRGRVLRLQGHTGEPPTRGRPAPGAAPTEPEEAAPIDNIQDAVTEGGQDGGAAAGRGASTPGAGGRRKVNQALAGLTGLHLRVCTRAKMPR